MGFADLLIDVDYAGRGEDILRDFVLPVMTRATEYDRVTSFFTTESLVAIADGLDELRRRGGRMRLVLGLHDVPEDLAQAALQSEDPAAEVVEEIGRRILIGIASISDELSADRLSTVAWMMKDQLLSVRVAAPRRLAGGSSGLFHNKLFIFRDEEHRVVAAVGSPNETGAGLGSNFEHLTAFTSWEQPRYTEAQVTFFERLWKDEQEGLVVVPLDAGFADRILAALPRTARCPEPQLVEEALFVRSLLDAAARMPSLAMVSGNHAALYPHQELAFIEGLSRWPVRVMLADEVGLGKTFEAGAALAYLLRHSGAKRAVALVPKAVLFQWQAELQEHFGLDAWVFDSGRRAFVSPNDLVRVLGPNEPVFGESTPDVVIMSAQLARGTRKGGHIFAGAAVMPDVLVVDEAHAARVRPDLAGDERPTLMWHLLNDIMPSIPHVIFATATPMQVHWREYHALLQLLGLPDVWRKPENYHKSLELVTLRAAPTLDDAGLMARLIRDSVLTYQPRRMGLDTEEEALCSDLLKADNTELACASLVMSSWSVAQRLLVKVHPARFLTVRNTRSALEAIGYQFPLRSLPDVALSVPRGVLQFYEHVERYLSEAYFDLERALFPNRKFSIGFVKCAYQQRLASSLEACRLSLMRRRGRISQAEADMSSVVGLGQDFDELAESEIFEQQDVFESPSSLPEEADIAGAVHAARIERQYLDDLLRMLERILKDNPDPKMAMCESLLRRHMDAGDAVLVFSRYTDTLDAVVQTYRLCFEEKLEPYAVYTGQSADIDLGTGLRRSSRREIRQALDSGSVRIVFCSDAASEGLNLQAARVLINVDVPWNPARLEQRIGRIARLGQQSTSVDVYNLWYPDSIEAKMYRRLMERRDLYELAVGEFPDVVGASIRSQLRSSYSEVAFDDDVVGQLNRLKNDLQIKALRGLWTRDLTDETMTSKFRDQLSSLAMAAAAEAGCTVSDSGSGRIRVSSGERILEHVTQPGSDDVISLTHPVLQWLGCMPMAFDGHSTKVLCGQNGPQFFEMDGKVVSPRSVVALLAGMAAPSDSLPIADLDFLTEDAEGDLRDEWLPNPNDLSVPAELLTDAPSRVTARLTDMTVEELSTRGVTTCE